MSSRIIVRNIPKNIDEKSLQKHFSKFGEVTDVKLIFKGNQNRRFCFIGFKQNDICKKSKEYFDRTYINTSKITIEYAKTKDQIEPIEVKKEISNQEKVFKKKKKENDNLIDIPKDKIDKFNEFLQLMKVQSKSTMSWNDNINKTQKRNEVKQNLDQFEEVLNKKNKRKEKQLSKSKQQKEKQEIIQQQQQQEEEEEQSTKQEGKTINTKRLYVLNLPFAITEDDIRNVFNQFGTVTELKMPKNKEGQFVGYVFVTYEIEEEAMRAFAELDNKVVFGRIMHVRPAFENQNQKNYKNQQDIHFNKQEYEQNLDQTSYKKEKRIQMKKKLNDQTSWNTLFLNPNTILAEISSRFNIKKSDILTAENSNLAVRQAQAETQIINETKDWMLSQNLNLDFLERDRVQCERSNTIILVKNLSEKVSEDLLREKFSHFGVLERILMCPNKSIALVQFSGQIHAQNAFNNLSYHPLKHNPLYLEWAPIDIIQQKNENQNNKVKQIVEEQEIDEKQIIQNILYIKNLNFITDVRDLQDLFENAQIGQIKSCKIVRKSDGKSAGFAFIEFNNHEAVEKSIKKLQNTILDEHALKLSYSKKKEENQNQRKQRKLDIKHGNKIIVRNLAFEANKNELKELFKTFGEIKAIRIPKKMDGSHRGFAFIEFVSAEEANQAFSALENSHFYGRKLVIEWAKTDEK